MFPSLQHFEGVEGRAGAQDGTRKSDKHQLFTWTCTKPTKGDQCIVEALWVLKRTTGNLDSQDSPRPKLWGKPPPSPLQYTLCLSTKATSKCLFVLGLPIGSFEIVKVGTPATFGPHNFVCRPPTEMRSKTKLQPS